MAKIQSIVKANVLQHALAQVPKGGEEELPFQAILGTLKGKKEERGGLFVGRVMLTAFPLEKKKLDSPKVFKGTIKRSEHDEKRLVLVSDMAGDPIKRVAKACVAQAKLPYKIVVLKPDEEEPKVVIDEEPSDGQEPEKVPSPEPISDIAKRWEEDSKIAWSSFQTVKGNLNEKVAETMEQLYKLAEKAAQSGDYGRALSRLQAMDRMAPEGLKKVPGPDKRYEQSRERASKVIQKLKEKLPSEKTEQIEARYQKGLDLAKDGRYEEAIQLLDGLKGLAKGTVEGVLWEQKIKPSEYELSSTSKMLGQGTFGVTYLLDKPDPEAPGLVIKVAKSGKEEYLDYEAEMYRKIGNHPNIARSLGIQKVGGNKEGLVLEGISGGEVGKTNDRLKQKLKDNAITQEEYWGVAQFTLVRTLEVLEHMSDLGYAHIDLKPDNMMYDGETGELKVIDLGTTQESGKGFGGTPGFMGPETLSERSKGGGQSDIFSTGAVTYVFGENAKRFGYNRSFMPTDKDVKEYAKNEEQALHLEDEEHPASKEVDEKTGRREKVVGRYAAETEYVKFVNWLLNPDPTKRPSPREALNHPFLKDRPLSDDQAKALITNSRLNFSWRMSWPEIKTLLLKNGVPEETATRLEKLLKSEAEAHQDLRKRSEDLDKLDKERRAELKQRKEEQRKKWRNEKETWPENQDERDKLKEQLKKRIKEQEKQWDKEKEQWIKEEEEKPEKLTKALKESKELKELRAFAQQGAEGTTNGLVKGFWQQCVKECDGRDFYLLHDELWVPKF